MSAEILRVFLRVLATAALADGHAYLLEPRARNVVRPGEMCPHCGQGGGPDNVKPRSKGAWPTHNAYGGHGLCGDPFQGEPNTEFKDETYIKYVTEPQATYRGGQIVDFVVAISTHHRGHFSFRLCDRVIDASIGSAETGQKCLEEHVLERIPPEQTYGDCKVNDDRGDCQPVDPLHPGRWYLPPASKMVQVAGEHWSDEAAAAVNTPKDVYHMKYLLPDGFTCDKCTLQWYWATGNTCIYDEGYFNYFKNIFVPAGWDGQAWSQFAPMAWANMDTAGCGAEKYGEEFWNCADIRVLPASGGASPRPSPSPSPRPRPSPQPRPRRSPRRKGRRRGKGRKNRGKHRKNRKRRRGRNRNRRRDKNGKRRLGEKGKNRRKHRKNRKSRKSPKPSPEPVPEPEPKPEPPGPAKRTVHTGTDCRTKCGEPTGDWASSFSPFEGNNDFCGCGFGGSCGFICGGGVDGSSGGQCPKEACTSGQYTFVNDIWTMSVSQKQAKGKSPYRAFAYMPLCMGKPTASCSPTKDFTLAFSFRTDGLEGWGGYVKLLFWTDGGNIIGLLPPGCAAAKIKGKSKYTLVTFMTDDYPNEWTDEVEIEDGKWYNVLVHFKGESVSVTVAGMTSKRTKFAVDVWTEINGPQLGVYHFDVGGAYTSKSFTMSLTALSGPGGNLERHNCEHNCLEGAPDAHLKPGTVKPHKPTSTKNRRRSIVPSLDPKPAPRPTPKPKPSGPSFCCFHPKDCGGCTSKASDSEWCAQSSGNCGTCGGLFCER